LSVSITPTIFRAYDIRGVYGETITEAVARVLGRAFAEYMGPSSSIVVGRDVRLSSPSLEQAFTEGLLEGGCDVIKVGLQPTPFVYYGIIEYNAKGGVVVSASHNPPNWNGFKLCRERGLLIAEGMGLEEIKRLALQEKFERRSPGRTVVRSDLAEKFTALILSKVKINDKIKVALDPGNGSCSSVASDIFRRAGIEVVSINDRPDGSFPNRAPEPTEENVKPLAELVRRENCDFGLAFDGDGDRAFFLDENGNPLSSDIVLAVFARSYLSQFKGKVLIDVACSMALEKIVAEMGGTLVVSRVGHSYMLHKMIQESCLIGGEISGHMYFSEIHGLDDAIFAGLKMAELIAKEGELSSLVKQIPHYPATPVITYPCPDNKKFLVVSRLKREFEGEGYDVLAIDGVKIRTERGWALVRASNTLPQIKLRFEALTEPDLQELRQKVEGKLYQVMKECID